MIIINNAVSFGDGIVLQKMPHFFNHFVQNVMPAMEIFWRIIQEEKRQQSFTEKDKTAHRP